MASELPFVTPPPYPAGARRKDAARRRRVLVGCTATPLLFALLLALLWYARMADPVVKLPVAPVPRPNAFDVYLRATKQLVRENDIGDAVAYAPKRRLSVAEKTALLRANAPALATWRQGLALPYREPAPVPRSFDTLFPHYAKFRALARLSVLDGRLRTARGDTSGAMSAHLDAVQFGQRIPRGAVLIGRLVGIACQAVGRRPVWEMMPRLDVKTARAGARRMETILAQNVGLDETLTEEKYLGQGGLMEMFREPERVVALSRDEDEPPSTQPGGDRLESAFVRGIFFIYGKRRILNDYTTFMDRFIVESRRPYAEHPSLPPLPADPINRYLLPVYSEIRLKHVEGGETQNALLTAALAVQAYRAEHGGAAPPTLAALVPAYLKSVPADPFAATQNAPLGYRVALRNAPVIYSVGPDGKDDHGAPINDPAATGNKRRYVTKTSRGDVVAGVNIF